MLISLYNQRSRLDLDDHKNAMDLDEYEMMCIRGASPVGGAQSHHRVNEGYTSDASTTSDSYDSEDYRRYRNRNRDRPTKSNNNKQPNNNNNKRRRDNDTVCTHHMANFCVDVIIDSRLTNHPDDIWQCLF